MKYIVVTGGVLSGLGKGVAVASIGRILKDRGYKVAPLKIDGYVNVDPGTMNPYEHGEVYVLDDGSETDLDLGHYERFLNENLTGASNITTGSVYKTVIDKERKGEYLGKTVQIIPHITDEIKDRIKRFNSGKTDVDIVLIEVGGTVGDMENRIFIEALRQMKREKGNEMLFIHLSYVPVILSGEQKTKPTQHSVKELLALGIQPDIILGRCEEPLTESTKKKIALFCGLNPYDVLSNADLPDIYLLPIELTKQDLGGIIIKKLGLESRPPYTFKWDHLVEKIMKAKKEVNIGIIGKYTGLEDAYLSIKESLKHAGAANGCIVNNIFIESETASAKDYKNLDGMIVPGGFGGRGVEGKIKAITYARENGLPFLGICLGFQLAVVEYARNVCGLKNANTTETDEKTPYPVIDLIPEQKDVHSKGGTMRLGSFPCKIKKDSIAHKLYESEIVDERHRHRWEVNPDYIQILEKNGLLFSGVYEQRNLMELAEIPSHPYFIATQAHPEFKSRLENPAPLFSGLVKAALKQRRKMASE
ncbi:MAG TPA: CTP synthase (glutamine hydrolyzing) [Candidatus Altiarchaeales archaeon]|nr:CTP synthase (glutamine hydrolyzing) [Candidatus Altiarchaeales archaeon]